MNEEMLVSKKNSNIFKKSLCNSILSLELTNSIKPFLVACSSYINDDIE